MNNEEYSELERRLDDRYKKLSDCDRDMDGMKKEHNDLLVLVTSINTTLVDYVDRSKWFYRGISGAIIAAIIAAIFKLISGG